MPKVSVYLPDDLYAKAREMGLSFSEITQDALKQRLAVLSVDEWLVAQERRPSRRDAHTVFTEDLMDAVDDEFGA